jgi:hypothetical protein
MARKLTPREKRMIEVGVIAVVAILSFTFGPRVLQGWGEARASLAAARSRLGEVEADAAKQAGLVALVPACQAPEPEEKQKVLFRDQLHEQLKKAGINTEPLQIIGARKVSGLPYKVLKVKCKGKCKFDQLLDFLAGLKENPYLVGVEELRVTCDTKVPPEKRNQVEIDLTVSTFAK